MAEPKDDDLTELVRTSLVGMSERLAERALSGELRGVVIVSILADGKIEASFQGCPMSEAIGSLQIGQGILLRKIMS